MKVVLLAGGKGTRMGAPGHDNTLDIPKALVPVLGIPILERVMAIYARHGFDDFLVVGGHLVDHLKAWVNSSAGPRRHGWRVSVRDTGVDTDTGSRLARIVDDIPGETFLLSWCDGIADVDVTGQIRFHHDHKRAVTLTAVHPPERFGLLDLMGTNVSRFHEKPLRTDTWVNGAFFVVQRSVLESLSKEGVSWERDVLTPLARHNELKAWRHAGHWHCMDTAKDHAALEDAFLSGAFQRVEAA